MTKTMKPAILPTDRFLEIHEKELNAKTAAELKRDAWAGDALIRAAVTLIVIALEPKDAQRRNWIVCQAVSNEHMAICCRSFIPRSSEGVRHCTARNRWLEDVHKHGTRLEAAVLYEYRRRGGPNGGITAAIEIAKFLIGKTTFVRTAELETLPIDNTQIAALTAAHESETSRRDTDPLRAHEDRRDRHAEAASG